MSSKKKKSVAKQAVKAPAVKPDFLEVYYPSEYRPADEPKVSKNPVWLILCFFVPFILFGICIALSKVVPFDDKTIFYADFKAQYYPFLHELQSKLQNGGSLLWTWNSGFGSNFIGMIGYYLSSPVYLLLAFLPESLLIVGINLLMMIKFGLSGLFTGIFLKKVFRRNDVSILAFSLCYAFSNFMMGYYWNILWLDTIALLPLVALGVYQLVYEKKFKLYVISLALGIISNYYIGYMLCVFTLIWFFALWIKYPKRYRTAKAFWHSFGSIAIFSVIALCLSAFLVVPVYFQLQNSASTNATGLKDVKFYYDFFEILGNTIGFHDPTKIEGLPNTYGGLICLVLFIIFARCKKISLVERITEMSFVGFMFFCLNWSPLDFMWHGFHEPNKIPSRFAFIFVFLMIIVAYRAFTLLKYVKPIDIAFSAGFCVLVLISALCFNINIVFSTIFMGFYLIAIWLYELKTYNLKVLTWLVCIVVIGEMCYNCYNGVKFVGTTASKYASEEEINTLVDRIQEEDTDFYRMEETYVNSKNDGMWYAYHGMGQFSSTSSKNVVNMTGSIGLSSMKLSFQTLHTSPVLTSLFNLKYYIARDNGYIADDPTLTPAYTEGSTTLYKYNYYLPLGFMVDNNLASYDLANYDSNNPFNVQNELYKSATGISDDVYSLINVKQYSINEGSITSNDIANGKYNYSCSSKNKVVTLKYTADKDGEYYSYVNVRDDAKKVTIASNSINHTYDVESKRYIFPIGNYKAGDEITMTCTLSEGNKGSFIVLVASFDEEKFANGYENLNDETMNITSYSDTVVEGTVSAKADGLFYASIPDEAGWKVYVDGNKVDKTLLIGSFIGVPITAGEHTIRFEYFPQGLIIGIIISVIALIAFIVICIIFSMKNKKEKNENDEGV